MRDVSLWRGVFGVEQAVIGRVEFDEDAGVLIAHVPPTKRQRARCGRCRRRCPGYDAGAGRARWRALDLGTMVAVLEADAPRVTCRVHGVVVAHVPWARHDAGHTLAFDDQVAWLATQAGKSTVTELMRIAWRTVGSIISRVWADIDSQHDRLAGLRRIGIAEISCQRGHKYLMVVVDILVSTIDVGWCGPRRDATAPPSASSSTSSAHNAARRSPTSPRMGRTSSTPSSPNRARTRSGPPIRSTPRSTSSHGRPRRSMRSAARRGTMLGDRPGPSRNGLVDAPGRHATQTRQRARHGAQDLPAREQGVHPPPGPVPLRDVPPRATAPDSVPNPVDHAAQRVPAWAAEPRRCRQERLEQRPLGVGQVMTRSGVYRGHRGLPECGDALTPPASLRGPTSPGWTPPEPHQPLS